MAFLSWWEARGQADAGLPVATHLWTWRSFSVDVPWLENPCLPPTSCPLVPQLKESVRTPRAGTDLGMLSFGHLLFTV